MSFKHQNKILVAALATTVALGGGVGVAAASNGSQDAPSRGSAAEERETNEDVDVQDPELGGSIQVEEVEGESEQQEEARLAALAKVTQAAAEEAALAGVPGGTVVSSEVGDENGSLIWEVEVTDAAGSLVEVKVDAGNGTVLDQEAEDDEDEEDEDDEQDEDADEAETETE